MSTFDLGRIRAEFKGDWLIGSSYEFLDLVTYGGNLYAFVDATAATGSNPHTDTVRWKLAVPGMKHLGAWSNAVSYKVGHAVNYGGKSYVALLDNTASAPPNSNWQLVASGIQYEGTYAGGTAYQPADLVKYGGNIYNCLQASTGNLPTNNTYWSRMVPGLLNRGAFATATAYLPGEFVTFGGGVYTTKTIGFTSTTNPPVDTANWELLLAPRTTGTAILAAGVATVANAAVAAGSIILLTSQVDGGTPGWLRVSTRSNGVSFTITSSSNVDTSTVGWEIINP
jgi:hypothetical protein